MGGRTGAFCAKINTFQIKRKETPDIRGADPFCHDGQPGMGPYGAELLEVPAGAGLSGISYYGLRRHLCGAGAEYRCGGRYLHNFIYVFRSVRVIPIPYSFIVPAPAAAGKENPPHSDVWQHSPVLPAGPSVIQLSERPSLR